MPTTTKVKRVAKPASTKSKPAASKASTTTKSKNTTVKKPAAKSKTTKAAPAKAETETPKVARDFDVFGFVVGSDSSIIAHTLVEGVTEGGREGMVELVRERIEAANGLQTRNGTEKYIPSLVSGVLLKLRKQGFTEESSFKVVPPAELAQAVATVKRKAARANNTAGKTKVTKRRATSK